MKKIESLESASYKAQFLESNGWEEKKLAGPWRWLFPKYPGALHTLEHAYDIAKSGK